MAASTASSTLGHELGRAVRATTIAPVTAQARVSQSQTTIAGWALSRARGRISSAPKGGYTKPASVTGAELKFTEGEPPAAIARAAPRYAAKSSKGAPKWPVSGSSPNDLRATIEAPAASSTRNGRARRTRAGAIVCTVTVPDRMAREEADPLPSRSCDPAGAVGLGADPSGEGERMV